MKIVMKMIAVLGMAAVMTGCGTNWDTEPPVKGTWDEAAGNYMNSHLPPFKVQDGRTFHLEVIKLPDINEVVMRVFVDGKMRLYHNDFSFTKYNAMTHGIGHAAGSVVEWSPEYGYRVQLGDATEESITNLISEIIRSNGRLMAHGKSIAYPD